MHWAFRLSALVTLGPRQPKTLLNATCLASPVIATTRRALHGFAGVNSQHQVQGTLRQALSSRRPPRLLDNAFPVKDKCACVPATPLRMARRTVVIQGGATKTLWAWYLTEATAWRASRGTGLFVADKRVPV